MFDKLFELGEQPYTQADAEWDDFVAAHPHGSLLQTTNWARLKNRFNWSSQRVWLRRDGQLSAGAQILFRSAALGLAKLAYIPHGPLVDWQDKEQIEVLFSQIDMAAYKHRAGILKMEPFVWQEEMPSDKWNDIQRTLGRNLVTGDTIQPPSTMIIDLRPTLDEILAAMKSKTRYNIRLSARKDVVVREGTIDDISTFNELMQVTGQRDSFGVHAPIYYKSAYQLFAPEQASLWIAEYENHPLAAVMVFAIGRKAAYFYGASSDDERNRMPNYAAQWAAIKWAKERGSTSYDLWGVPDHSEDELEAGFTQRRDGLWGVYRFKRGFGGKIKRTVGTFDRVYNRRLYKLYQWRRKRASA
jgi:lipid II:glycine glycyltransferase (peptidoglycan interpeptide bridge formation enzyme)